eukprot:3326603-Lingulodinium_polyedra.AAC.1
MQDCAGRAPIHAPQGARQTESPRGKLPAHLEKQSDLRCRLQYLRGAVVLARRSVVDDTRSQGRLVK